MQLRVIPGIRSHINRTEIALAQDTKAHWAECLAHELGHKACGHLDSIGQPINDMAMLIKEVQAWEWAVWHMPNASTKFLWKKLDTYLDPKDQWTPKWKCMPELGRIIAKQVLPMTNKRATSGT